MFNLSSASASNLNQSRILFYDKELTGENGVKKKYTGQRRIRFGRIKKGAST